MHAGPGGRPEMDEDEMLRRLRGHRSTGTEDQEFFRKQVGIAAGKQRTAGVMAGMKRADDAMAEVGHLNAERDKLITRRGAILDKTTVDRPALSRIDRKIASLDTMIATATGVDITEQRQPFNKDTKDSLNQIGDAQASIEALLEIREQLEKHGFPVLGIAGKAGKFFQSARGFARGVDSALGGGSTFKDLYDGGVNDLFEDAAAGSEYAQSMLDEWSASRATPGAFAKAFSSEESRARTQVDVATKIMAYRLARLISGKTSRLAFADTEQVRSMLDFDTMGQSPERARDQVDILLHEARRSYRGYRKVFEMDPAFGDAYLDRWGYSRHWGETGVEGSVPGGISSGGPRPTISDATAEVLSEGAP